MKQPHAQREQAGTDLSRYNAILRGSHRMSSHTIKHRYLKMKSSRSNLIHHTCVFLTHMHTASQLRQRSITAVVQTECRANRRGPIEVATSPHTPGPYRQTSHESRKLHENCALDPRHHHQCNAPRRAHMHKQPCWNKQSMYVEHARTTATAHTW